MDLATIINHVVVIVIAISMMMTSQHVLGAPIQRTSMTCTADYWNDPCDFGDRPTDAPTPSEGVEFFKKEAALFGFINKCLERRKREYIDDRIKDQGYLNYLDANLNYLDGLPAVPDYTLDLKKKEDDVIRNATRDLTTIAVFNEQIVIDELAFESSASPFAGYFQEMKGYYQNNLCRLREEMRSRGIALPGCQDFSVIPITLRQLQNDRSSRHDRDYFIVRDTQKIILGYAMQFARIYAASNPKRS